MRTPVPLGVVTDDEQGQRLLAVLSRLGRVDVRWVCDESPLRRPQGGPQHTHQLEDLLADEALDAIVFGSTRAAAHGRAKSALLSEKHVLVPTPLSFRLDEAEEILAAAASVGRHALTYAPWLHRPGVRRLHELVRQGQVGDLYYVDAEAHAPTGPGGPRLWSVGIEVVETILSLLGDAPVGVDAHDESYVDPAEIDVLRLRLSFATGVSANLIASRLHGDVGTRYSVVGSKGTAVLERGAAGETLVFLPVGVDVVLQGGWELRPRDSLEYGLPADDSAERACAAFLSALSAPPEPGAWRTGFEALGILERLGRGAPSTHVPAAWEDGRTPNLVVLPSA